MLKFIATAALIAAFSAEASADVFVKIDGVAGDSTNANRKDWIDAASATDGVTAQFAPGGAAGLGKPQLADVVIAKGLDRASVVLRAAAARGAVFKNAVIEFERQGPTPALEYRITLQDVSISSVQGALTGAAAAETVALAYRRIQWEYFPVNAKGGVGAPVTASATR